MVTGQKGTGYHVHTPDTGHFRSTGQRIGRHADELGPGSNYPHQTLEICAVRTGQSIGQWGQELTRARRTLASVAVLALLLAAGVWWWLASRDAEPPAPAAAALLPGGELVASMRSDPSTYNRYVPAGANAATDLLSLLVHARLIRVNRATDGIEPMLAERWTGSDNGLTYTLALRQGVRFSDGAPFTAADVLFSFRAAYDPSLKSPIGSSLLVNGSPIAVSAPDDHTVVLTFPEPFAPGLRLLDNLPILPKHRLERALDEGRFADAWSPSQPLTEIAGLGPFILAEHLSGQRLVLTRNPNYFRKDARGVQLPYLDRLTIAVVPDQNTEALRLEAGETDLMYSGEIRPQDYAGFQQSAEEGRLRLIDVGVGLDPDFLSFNLRPSRASDPRAPWLQRKEFRQAVAWAVNRQAIVDTVYLGAAVPVSGPVTPGNRTWYAPGTPAYTHDPARARTLLAGLGLRDQNGDGLLEDARGEPARFSILTQAGHNRERVAAVIQEHLRQVGLVIDVVTMDPGGLFARWSAGDYDTMYFGLQASSTDPWVNPEFWLSSGGFHFWNPGQPAPATGWEARIDALMREHAGDLDLNRRREAFAEVQRILAEELPSVYFVAPRVTLATSPRVLSPTPAPQIPQLLWSADTLAAAPRR